MAQEISSAWLRWDLSELTDSSRLQNQLKAMYDPDVHAQLARAGGRRKRPPVLSTTSLLSNYSAQAYVRASVFEQRQQYRSQILGSECLIAEQASSPTPPSSTSASSTSSLSPTPQSTGGVSVSMSSSTVEGLRSQVVVLRELANTDTRLAARFLASLSQRIQTLPPGSLRQEESEFLEELFVTLTQLEDDFSRQPPSPPSSDAYVPSEEERMEFLSTLNACLASLVVALGKANELIRVALRMALSGADSVFFNVPMNVCNLHETLTTVMTQRTCAPSSTFSLSMQACIDQFCMPVLEAADRAVLERCAPGMVALASDGNHLYLHTPTFILKVGTGYGGTVPGGLIRMARLEAEYPLESGGRLWIGCVDGMILRRFSNDPPGLFAVIDPVSLAVLGLARTESNDNIGEGPCVLFSTGVTEDPSMAFALAAVEACTLSVWRIRYLRLGEDNVLRTFRADRIDCQETRLVSYSPRDHSTTPVKDEVVGGIIPQHVICSRNSTIILTADNRIFRYGPSSKLALPVSEVMPSASSSSKSLSAATTSSKWQNIALPRDEVVTNVALSPSDDSCLLFCAGGLVYVAGDPSWEPANLTPPSEIASGKSAQDLASKFRPVKSLLAHEVVEGSCSENLAAVIAKDGTLLCAGLNLAESMRWRPISKSKLIYRNGVVVGQEYLNLVSRFNASYWCEIRTCIIEKNSISIEFTVKTSDLSLGPLQEPDTSTLSLDKNSLAPSEVLVSDRSDKHISGTLKYDTSGIEIDGNMAHFSYGAGGYSKAVLFDRVRSQVVYATPDEADCTPRGITVSADGQQVNLSGSGPKLLISKQAVSNGIICWKWRNLGNNAIEFGVVSSHDLSDYALHKNGKTGFFSSSTSGSNLPMKLTLKERPVEVVCDATEGVVRYIVSDGEVHTQNLAMNGWKKGDPVRLAVTLWAGGKIQLQGVPDVGSLSLHQHTFVPAEFQHKAVHVATGLRHICVISNEGRVFGAGLNNSGQCGKRAKKPTIAPNGKEEEVKVLAPQEIPLPPDVFASKVACGSNHSVIMTLNGGVFTIGSNSHKQLGRDDVAGSETDVAGPVQLPPDVTAVDIAAFGNKTVILLSNSSLLVFGGEDAKAGAASNPVSLDKLAFGTPTSIAFSDEFSYIICKETSISPLDLESATAMGTDSECSILIPPRPEDGKGCIVTFAKGGVKSACSVPSFDASACVCSIPSQATMVMYAPRTNIATLHNPLLEMCPAVWRGTQKKLLEPSTKSSDANNSGGSRSSGSDFGGKVIIPDITPVDLGDAAERTARALLHPLSSFSSTTKAVTSVPHMGASILSLLASFYNAQPLMDSIREFFSVCDPSMYQAVVPFLNLGSEARIPHGQWDSLVFTVDKPTVLAGLLLAGQKDASSLMTYRVVQKTTGKVLVSGEESVFGTSRGIFFSSAVVLLPNTLYAASAAYKPPAASSSSAGASATPDDGFAKRPVAKDVVDEFVTDDGVSVLFPSAPSSKSSNVVGLMCSSCDNLMTGIYKELQYLKPDVSLSITHVGLSSLFDGLEHIVRELRTAQNNLGVASHAHFLASLGSTCLNLFEQNLLARFHIDSLGVHSEVPKNDLEFDEVRTIVQMRDFSLSVLEDALLCHPEGERLRQNFDAFFKRCFRIFFPTNALRRGILIQAMSRQLALLEQSPSSPPTSPIFRAVLDALSHSRILELFQEDMTPGVYYDKLILRKARKTKRKNKLFKTRDSFSSENDYVTYVKATLKVGMKVRMVRSYESVEAGDTGTYLQTNSGSPPAQVRWKNYGSTYWVYWKDIEIISDDGVDVSDPDEDSKSKPTVVIVESNSFAEMMAQASETLTFSSNRVEDVISALSKLCVSPLVHEVQQFAQSTFSQDLGTTSAAGDKVGQDRQKRSSLEQADQQRQEKAESPTEMAVKFLVGLLEDLSCADWTAMSVTPQPSPASSRPHADLIRDTQDNNFDHNSNRGNDATPSASASSYPEIPSEISSLLRLIDDTSSVFEMLASTYELHSGGAARSEDLLRSVSSSRFCSRLVPLLLAVSDSGMQRRPAVSLHFLRPVQNLLKSLARLNSFARNAHGELFPLEHMEMGWENAIIVESAHPYKPVQRDKRVIKFSEEVLWICLDLDPRCHTGQPEDTFEVYLKTAKGEDQLLLKKMHTNKNWPNRTLLLPGNEVTVCLSSASQYLQKDSRDAKNFYGFRCVAIGYTRLDTGVGVRFFDLLEREVALFASRVCGVMFKRDEEILVAEGVGKGAPAVVEYAPLVWSSTTKGSNIEVSAQGRLATRTKSYNNGTCMTQQPIAAIDGTKSFRLKITRHGESNWAGSLACGITLKAPDNSVLPSVASSMARRWYLSGSAVSGQSGSEQQSYNINGTTLDSLGIGATIDVIVTEDGNLRFAFNGKEGGIAATGIPFQSDIYAFADVYGMCHAVSIEGFADEIVGTGEGGSSSAASSANTGSNLCPSCKHETRPMKSAADWTCTKCKAILRNAAPRSVCKSCFSNFCSSCMKGGKPEKISTASRSDDEEGSFEVLPRFAWSTTEKSPNVVVQGLQLNVPNRDNKYCYGSTDVGFSEGCVAWEVKLVNDRNGDENVTIGTCFHPVEDAQYSQSKQMIVYRAYCGTMYTYGSSTGSGEKYHPGDVVRVELDFDKDTVTFFKNGRKTGSPLKGIAGKTMYPCVSFYNKDVTVELMKVEVWTSSKDQAPSECSKETPEIAAILESPLLVKGLAGFEVPDVSEVASQEVDLMASCLSAVESDPQRMFLRNFVGMDVDGSAGQRLARWLHSARSGYFADAQSCDITCLGNRDAAVTNKQLSFAVNVRSHNGTPLICNHDKVRVRVKLLPALSSRCESTFISCSASPAPQSLADPNVGRASELTQKMLESVKSSEEADPCKVQKQRGASATSTEGILTSATSAEHGGDSLGGGSPSNGGNSGAVLSTLAPTGSGASLGPEFSLEVTQSGTLVFVPSSPGQYEISVCVGNKHIKQSPMVVTVMESLDEDDERSLASTPESSVSSSTTRSSGSPSSKPTSLSLRLPTVHEGISPPAEAGDGAAAKSSGTFSFAIPNTSPAPLSFTFGKKSGASLFTATPTKDKDKEGAGALANPTSTDAVSGGASSLGASTPTQKQFTFVKSPSRTPVSGEPSTTASPKPAGFTLSFGKSLTFTSPSVPQGGLLSPAQALVGGGSGGSGGAKSEASAKSDDSSKAATVTPTLGTEAIPTEASSAGPALASPGGPSVAASLFSDRVSPIAASLSSAAPKIISHASLRSSGSGKKGSGSSRRSLAVKGAAGAAFSAEDAAEEAGFQPLNFEEKTSRSDATPRLIFVYPSVAEIQKQQTVASSFSESEAHCMRALFAAEAWHLGVVSDLITLAAYLKIRPDLCEKDFASASSGGAKETSPSQSTGGADAASGAAAAAVGAPSSSLAAPSGSEEKTTEAVASTSSSSALVAPDGSRSAGGAPAAPPSELLVARHALALWHQLGTKFSPLFKGRDSGLSSAQGLGASEKDKDKDRGKEKRKDKDKEKDKEADKDKDKDKDKDASKKETVVCNCPFCKSAVHEGDVMYANSREAGLGLSNCMCVKCFELAQNGTEEQRSECANLRKVHFAVSSVGPKESDGSSGASHSATQNPQVAWVKEILDKSDFLLLFHKSASRQNTDARLGGMMSSGAPLVSPFSFMAVLGCPETISLDSDVSSDHASRELIRSLSVESDAVFGGVGGGSSVRSSVAAMLSASSMPKLPETHSEDSAGGKLPYRRSEDLGSVGESRLANLARSMSLVSERELGDRLGAESAFVSDSSEMPSDALETLLSRPSLSLEAAMKLADPSADVLAFSVQAPVALRQIIHSLLARLKRGAVKLHALRSLTDLLLHVTSPSAIHDTLVQFCNTFVGYSSSSEDNLKVVLTDAGTLHVGGHPMDDFGLCGEAMTRLLRDAYQGFLLAVLELMKRLPASSPLQRAAIRCWNMRFTERDYAFIHRSRVFSVIGHLLANTDTPFLAVEPRQLSFGLSPQVSDACGVDHAPQERAQKARVCAGPSLQHGTHSHAHTSYSVWVNRDITAECEVSVSSRQPMLESLLDHSTETYWEPEDKTKNHQITVKYVGLKPRADDKDAGGRPVRSANGINEVVLHIDSTRDTGYIPSEIALKAGRQADQLQEIYVVKIGGENQSGWISLPCGGEEYEFVCVETRSSSGNQKMRVRQLSVFARPELETDTEVSSVDPTKATQSEVLAVFKQLTEQVFGDSLKTADAEEADPKAAGAAKDSDKAAAGAAGKAEDKRQDGSVSGSGASGETGDLKQHVVGLLFSKTSTLGNLQQAVCRHIMQEMHMESKRLISGVSERLAQGDVRDEYSFELISMLVSLSTTPVGAKYMGAQKNLVTDLITQLHFGSIRNQRAVISILARVLQASSPQELDLKVKVGLAPPSLSSSSSSAEPGRQSVLSLLLLVIAKALKLQVRTRTKGRQVTEMQLSGITALSSESVWVGGQIEPEIAGSVVSLFMDLTSAEKFPDWVQWTCAFLSKTVRFFLEVQKQREAPLFSVNDLRMWQAIAALTVLPQGVVDELQAEHGGSKDNGIFCDHHEDQMTDASMHCDTCGLNLCVSCDKFQHLSRARRDHIRSIITKEEPTMVIEQHEGCGRAKLPSMLALAERRELKAILEFKQLVLGASCRFCGTSIGEGEGMIALVTHNIKNCCDKPECLELAQRSCTKTHSCGHACQGIRDEQVCLPCLHGCKSAQPGSGDVSGASPLPGYARPLTQDKDDECMICFSGGLMEEPCIRVHCGHVMHARCTVRLLESRWTGPRIDFGFCRCPICRDSLLEDTDHPLLKPLLGPINELYEDVKRKSLMRLEYDGVKMEGPAQAKAKFAMDKYAYYICFKCKKPYFGGEQVCAAGISDFNPEELVCGACVGGSAAQLCAKHGTDYLEYKCRFCCAVAVFFCFGTTHFCKPCHDQHSKCVNCPKDQLPHCPAGPCLEQLPGDRCPLGIKHPPTGEEFALGCGLCRNAQTF